MFEKIIAVLGLTVLALAVTSCTSESGPEPLPAPINEPKPMEYCYRFLLLERELNETRLDKWKNEEIVCEGKITKIVGDRVKFRIEREHGPDDSAECIFLDVADVLPLNKGGHAAFAGKFKEFGWALLRRTVRFEGCRQIPPLSG